MPKIRNFILPLLYIAVISLTQCAHPVMPSGGPKDVTPPQVVGSEPGNYSTDFRSNKAVVSFDEFIELKDPQKEIFISPPLESKPEFKARGKSLVVEFTGPLEDSTTYSIFFGNSIVDITERNPKTNFEYVFSTGPEIDSLSITGKVVDAFTLKPVEEILVMLYRDHNDTIPFDSLPLLTRPGSASRSEKEGSFRLGNLRMDEYKIFALEDKNSNFIYDLPNERIAFLDSLVSPGFVPRRPADSILADSVVRMEYEEMVSRMKKDIQLLLFNEIDSIQRLNEATVISDFLLRFIFKYPAEDEEFRVLYEPGTEENWYLKEKNPSGDTVYCWLTGIVPDTMFIEVSAAGIEPDTVRMIMRRPVLDRRKKKDDELPVLSARANLNGIKLERNKDLILLFSRPVIDSDTSDLMLVEGTDTITTSVSFVDDVKRKAKVNHDWKEATDYYLVIPDSLFTGLGNVRNDSIKIRFNTRKLSDYGHLFLDCMAGSEDAAYIIQLLSRDEKVLREKYFRGNATVSFEYLLPGNYLVKAIRDDNYNMKWDAGDYLHNIQPEKVVFFSGTLDIRANWEVQESWQLP